MDRTQTNAREKAARSAGSATSHGSPCVHQSSARPGTCRHSCQWLRSSFAPFMARYWLSRSVVSNHRHGVVGEILAARLRENISAKGGSGPVYPPYMSPYYAAEDFICIIV